MTGPDASADTDQRTSTAPNPWALGDYHRFAKATVWEVGPVLVEACGIGAGQRVLDVAAGTGNVAIRAAEAGADVVASDLTAEHFEAGRREAREHGVDLEWVVADAMALPFADGEFDVVTSSFGAMFAADHQATADELVRVTKPGGTIGMLNFTPDGLIGAFLEALAPHGPPPPPGALPPPLWGDEDHVRRLFGGRIESLQTKRGSYVERAPDPEAYCELFTRTFGPVIAIRESLAGEPSRQTAFDRDLLTFATESNRAADGEPAEYLYEYLLVVARRGREDG